MKVGYHPLVQHDVSAILRHYGGIAPKLGNAFWEELLANIEATRLNPGCSHPAERELRRVNLQRFPYHFLFRDVPRGLRIIVVRHHRRHPRYGLGRR